MKYLSLLLTSSFLAACASTPPPPAASTAPSNTASSASVDAATETPSTSTDPVKTDVMRAAEADRAAEGKGVPPSTASEGEASAGLNGNMPATTTGMPAPIGHETSADPAPSGPSRSGTMPSDPGANEADKQLAQQVRQSVLRDASLSPAAKNVKVIAKDGSVTLYGTVKSERERSAVEASVKRVTGVGRVENLMEIAQ